MEYYSTHHNIPPAVNSILLDYRKRKNGFPIRIHVHKTLSYLNEKKNARKKGHPAATDISLPLPQIKLKSTYKFTQPIFLLSRNPSTRVVNSKSSLGSILGARKRSFSLKSYRTNRGDLSSLIPVSINQLICNNQIEQYGSNRINDIEYQYEHFPAHKISKKIALRSHAHATLH